MRPTIIDNFSYITSRFKKIDTEFRDIMTGVEADPRVLSLVNNSDINRTLDFLMKQVWNIYIYIYLSIHGVLF